MKGDKGRDTKYKETREYRKHRAFVGLNLEPFIIKGINLHVN